MRGMTVSIAGDVHRTPEPIGGNHVR
ncbi:hypothetical protein PSP6_440263 [Paraburkholderia tropica]|nr:hypothetical protein PSP6_440263 [Paraburkholderia tropica]